MRFTTVTKLNSFKSVSKANVCCALFGLQLLALLGAANVQADEYSAGMKAYMSDDYELAKTLWLEGAETKDAKSMFNLGLLHEQNLIEGADFAKAEQWYRLAGKNGYPAADYHLAQLFANKGVTQQSRELLQRSAARGYSPARNKLQNKPVSEADLKPGVLVAKGARYQNQQWIVAQQKSNWTIQMLAFDNLKKVQEYIDRHSLHTKAAYFAEPGSGGLLYKLVYGSFRDKQEADRARQQLPQQLKTNGPWLRSIESIQKIISN